MKASYVDAWGGTKFSSKDRGKLTRKRKETAKKKGKKEIRREREKTTTSLKRKMSDEFGYEKTL